MVAYTFLVCTLLFVCLFVCSCRFPFNQKCISYLKFAKKVCLTLRSVCKVAPSFWNDLWVIEVIFSSQFIGPVRWGSGFQSDTLRMFLWRSFGWIQGVVSHGFHTPANQPYYRVDDNRYQNNGQYREQHPEETSPCGALIIEQIIPGALVAMVTFSVIVTGIIWRTIVTEVISLKTVATVVALRARNNSH